MKGRLQFCWTPANLSESSIRSRAERIAGRKHSAEWVNPGCEFSWETIQAWPAFKTASATRAASADARTSCVLTI